MVDSSRDLRDLAIRIERAVRGRPGDLVDNRAVCKLFDITPRTLRQAFRVARGATPFRHLRGLRMAAARRALLTPAPGAQVTDIALAHGFPELGRFSVQYRRRYGEAPSSTLARALARLGAPQAVPRPAAPEDDRSSGGPLDAGCGPQHRDPTAAGVRPSPGRRRPRAPAPRTAAPPGSASGP